MNVSIKDKSGIEIFYLTPDRQHKLGSRRITELNHWYQYAKLDFGIVGKDVKTGKIYRKILYGWIPIRL